jgi:hypothetical protein
MILRLIFGVGVGVGVRVLGGTNFLPKTPLERNTVVRRSLQILKVLTLPCLQPLQAPGAQLRNELLSRRLISGAVSRLFRLDRGDGVNPCDVSREQQGLQASAVHKPRQRTLKARFQLVESALNSLPHRRNGKFKDLLSVLPAERRERILLSFRHPGTAGNTIGVLETWLPEGRYRVDEIGTNLGTLSHEPADCVGHGVLELFLDDGKLRSLLGKMSALEIG